jgi:hypothetical protein
MSDLSRRTAMHAASAVGGAILLGTLAQDAAAQVPGNMRLAPKDYAKEQLDSLAEINTSGGFCEKWKSTIRPILVAAAALLKITYPAGAKALELAISFIDVACGGMG